MSEPGACTYADKRATHDVVPGGSSGCKGVSWLSASRGSRGRWRAYFRVGTRGHRGFVCMEQSFTPADNGAEAVEAARIKAVAARHMWEHQWELGAPLLPYAMRKE